MHSIISFMIRKGGSGKTTSAVNTAAGLALEHKKTLLIDFDPQSNATKLSGLIDRKNKRLYDYSIQDVIENRKISIRKIIYETQYGYSIIPSHSLLKNGAVQLLASADTMFLKNLIKNTELLKFDYVIIDTSPDEGILPLNALFASDYIIIPMQTDDDARIAVESTIEMINNAKAGPNPNVELLGILPTLHYGVSSVSKIILQTAQEAHGELCIPNLVVRHRAAFKEASWAHMPLFYHNQKDYYDTGYHKLVNFIIKETK